MKLAVFIALFAIADGVHLNQKSVKLAQVQTRVQEITYADDFAASDLDSILSSNKVVVFVKSKCTYCQQVVDLLDNDDIDAYVINLDKVSDKQAVKDAVNERSNNSMVPKVFVNSRYIGMLSQLKEYEASGRLFSEVGITRPNMDCDAVGGCPEEGSGTQAAFPDEAIDKNAPTEIYGGAPSEEDDAESLNEEENNATEGQSSEDNSEESPVEENPEAPVSEAIPSEETPEEAPAEEAPAEIAPTEEAPAEEAPAEDTTEEAPAE